MSDIEIGSRIRSINKANKPTVGCRNCVLPDLDGLVPKLVLVETVLVYQHEGLNDWGTNIHEVILDLVVDSVRQHVNIFYELLIHFTTIPITLFDAQSERTPSAVVSEVLDVHSFSGIRANELNVLPLHLREFVSNELRITKVFLRARSHLNFRIFSFKLMRILVVVPGHFTGVHPHVLPRLLVIIKWLGIIGLLKGQNDLNCFADRYASFLNGIKLPHDRNVIVVCIRHHIDKQDQKVDQHQPFDDK